MPLFDVIVIGAGASGLVAAGEAARNASVLLLEKMEKPARKIRITGKGRCNITNTKSWDEFEMHIFPVARVFKPAFMNFTNTDVIRFMEQIGVPTVIERGNRVFPASSRAQDVAEALVRWVEKQNVKIHCKAEVIRLIEKNNKITAVEVRINGKLNTISAHAFIVATGGLSYPSTGSTGDGFRWAEETGHSIIPLRPSLVALTIANYPAELNGLALRNISLSLIIDGNEVDEQFGEMNFTDNGVDGATVLKLSHKAVDALMQNKKTELLLNCKPALNNSQIITRMQQEIITLDEQSLPMLLRGWLPTQLILPFIAQTKLSLKKKTSNLTATNIAQIASKLHVWKMTVSGHGNYERAVVTAGGVSMNDIDNKTMRSRKKNNLFFAGETLNLHADTGGYNLQIAFSTGYLAGKSAGKYIVDNYSFH